MAVTNDFKEAVKSRKMMRVHIMLKDSLLVDPTGTQFDEMERYAVEELGDIYTEHDGDKLNYDVASWNEDYLNEQMVAIINCFSKERIGLLKSMVRYLYKDKASKICTERDKASTTHPIKRRQIGTVVNVVGAALTVAGICTAQTALTIGGVVVIFGGVALIINEKGNVK